MPSILVLLHIPRVPSQLAERGREHFLGLVRRRVQLWLGDRRRGKCNRKNVARSGKGRVTASACPLSMLHGILIHSPYCVCLVGIAQQYSETRPHGGQVFRAAPEEQPGGEEESRRKARSREPTKGNDNNKVERNPEYYNRDNILFPDKSAVPGECQSLAEDAVGEGEGGRVGAVGGRAAAVGQARGDETGGERRRRRKRQFPANEELIPQTTCTPARAVLSFQVG